MSRDIKAVVIGLGVDDVQAAAEWYRSLLGDVEVIEAAPGIVEVAVSDDVWIQLDDTGYLEAGGNSSIVRFETDDINAAYLMTEGLVDEIEGIEEFDGMISYFDFKDPYGNRLSYYQLPQVLDRRPKGV